MGHNFQAKHIKKVTSLTFIYPHKHIIGVSVCVCVCVLSLSKNKKITDNQLALRRK